SGEGYQPGVQQRFHESVELLESLGAKVVELRLSEVAYVGAMGSRRTHDDRNARLREAGLTDAELSRLASPIGLDLGARTPEETAVSIAAEIIALRWGGGGERLAALGGPMHHERP
ncbi:MAG: XdhC family protein, partial [Nocardioidaceae bacterium]